MAAPSDGDLPADPPGPTGRRLSVAVRPVRKGGLAGLFRRKPSATEEPALVLGPDFFTVLGRVPEGWTRTLDALWSAEGDVVFGPLEIRMAVTELSRISPYAESAAEQHEFGAFRTLVGAVPPDHELVLTTA
ncbi:hypothetical protein [Cryptosporangium minutisporangium]|uniref:Uncharacterized protein n=1 Tax=Cryptosporangium minutisporangium TaxID=113569 RepID=A0ABP6T0F2_9ACTN